MSTSRQRIGAYWSEQYKKTRGITYPGHKKHEWIELERIRKVYGEPLIRWCIWHFLRHYEDDPWVSKGQGWSLFAFSARLPSLMIQARERKAKGLKDGFAQAVADNPQLEALEGQLKLIK